MSQDILNVINKLKKQPIFQLSLADKELFHSNFLAWITAEYPAFFLAVLEGMTTQEQTKVNTASWRDDFLHGKKHHDHDEDAIQGVEKQIAITRRRGKPGLLRQAFDAPNELNDKKQGNQVSAPTKVEVLHIAHIVLSDGEESVLGIGVLLQHGGVTKFALNNSLP